MRIGLWLLSCFAFLAAASHGAGVTVVTHGFQLSPGHPTWQVSMAEALAARAGNGTAILALTISRGANGSGLPLNYNATLLGSTEPFEAGSGELIVTVDWSPVANHFSTPYTTTPVAGALAQALLSTNLIAGHPFALAELPLHFIGHSRGVSVLSETARILGEQNIRVEQLTGMDPHPLTVADNFFNPTPVLDPVPVIWENITFADVYHQTQAYPDGLALAGAVNVLLDSRFNSNSSDAHSWTHDWYHGTVDLEGEFMAGVSPIPRAAWYLRGDYGFRLARLAGGQALKEALLENPAFAARTAIPNGVELAWPNATLALSTNTLQPGANLFLKMNVSAGTTIHLFADDNENPYDNGGDGASAVLLSRSFETNQQASIRWTPPESADGKFLAVEARLDGKSRFYYAPERLVIRALPTLTIGRSGTEILLTATAGAETATLQNSSDLREWTDIQTFSGTLSFSVEMDGGEMNEGSGHRFYRLN